ncbi:MAG TPA: hypothetical protein VFO40_17385 [Chthoniobacterales bacterium]|nr:hypothetical protein [Chthoniobacterales bacterium]
MNTPDRIAKLPIDRRGFPVPYFVQWINGEPDFRVVDAHKISEAIRYKKCWICGERLGRFLIWPIGPMCIINRTSSEPPSHRDCAEYAVRVCPFLANPNMRRNEHKLPEETVPTAGNMLRRNPGVVALWVSESYSTFRAPGGAGLLFHIGDPLEVHWYCEGRQATRVEILESIAGGLPFLREMAEQDGPEAVAEREGQHATALKLLPSL